MAHETIEFEWRELLTRGLTPSIRYNTASFMYKGDLWMVLGSGSGVGRSAEVWKFSVSSCKWFNMPCKGENVPSSRDGHSITYIGNGKFVLFGGQGFPYTNEKSEKITDIQKVKTYFVREVYNNLYEFDCETLTWKALLIDGASLPMGRRGHIAFYSPHGSNFYRSVRSSHEKHDKHHQGYHHGDKHDKHHQGHHHGHEEEILGLPENSLIVFGGAGVEPSKYTEILYNDLWAYSFDTTRWTRVVTRGIEPRPIFDHKAELIGDHTLIVVGGITGITAQQRKMENMVTSDVMALNTKTLTWSYVDIFDRKGRPAHIRLHGHSLVQEKRGGPIYLFGGRETVDAKRAAIEIAPALKSGKSKAIPICWKLDVFDQVTITPFFAAGQPTEGRYGHVGASMQGVEEILEGSVRTENDNLHHPGAAPAALGPGGKGAGGLASVLKQSNKVIYENYDEPIMLVYGGTKVENFGLCESAVYQLVKRHIFPEPTEEPPPAGGIGSGTGTGVAAAVSSDLHSVGGGMSVSFSQGSLPHASSGDVLSNVRHDDDLFEQSEERRLTIWQKKKLRPTLSPRTDKSKADLDKNPTNWGELKLAMTFPLSEKITMASESRKQLLSRQNSLVKGQPSLGALPRLGEGSAAMIGMGRQSSTLSGVPASMGRFTKAASSFSIASRGSASVMSAVSGGGSTNLSYQSHMGNLADRSSSLSRLDSESNGDGSELIHKTDADREKEKKLRVKRLAADLLPAIKGLTVHDAKDEFLMKYPPPYAGKQPFVLTDVPKVPFNRKFASIHLGGPEYFGGLGEKGL